MKIYPNLPPDIEIKVKQFRPGKRMVSNYYFESNGERCLMVHGNSNGKLTIEDSDLEAILPFIDTIICCYPRRICEVYEPIFPGITKKILHKWADIPTCYGIFKQDNGKKAMLVLDYSPSRKEWNRICDEIRPQIKALG